LISVATLRFFLTIDRDLPSGAGQRIKDLGPGGGYSHPRFAQPLHIGRDALNAEPEKPVECGYREPVFQR